MRFPPIAAIALLLAAPAIAESGRLDGQRLGETVPGSVIELDTPIGTKIPMRFGTDGLVTGEAGVLGTYLGAAKDRGRYWVENDQLCIKWFRWFESEPRCMEIRAEGTRIFWRRQDGDSGTATLTQMAKPKPPPPEPVVAAAPPTPAPPASPVADDKSNMPIQAEVAAAADAGSPHEQLVRTESLATPPPPARPMATASIDGATSQADPAKTAVATAASPSKPVTSPRAQAGAKTLKPVAASRNAVTQSAKMPPMSFRVARVEPDDILNVRNGPSEYHKAIGTIPPHGRGVEIVGACVDLWCPIRHGKVTGWVNSFYLAEESHSSNAQVRTP